jgi:polyhydroxyalkanoate synthesis repressor PhaR
LEAASAADTARPGDRRQIRLYSNRRLYDTVDHRYITYRDLRQLVKKGLDFVIVDERRAVDHTDRILLDLMLRCAAAQRSSDKNVVVPDGLLRELIALKSAIPITMVREFLDESMRNLTLASARNSTRSTRSRDSR